VAALLATLLFALRLLLLAGFLPAALLLGRLLVLLGLLILIRHGFMSSC